MGPKKKPTGNPGGERNVGNIYDRLDEARRKRERILETPPPANDDRRAKNVSKPVSRSFPTLKPPASDAQDAVGERDLDWTIPWLLGLVIFAVIFGFAVG